ncbi:hypothetical protein J2T20_003874 [Paenibacillus wynnii]|nr:hypothetical protein [Paenibacillus wynnii]
MARKGQVFQQYTEEFKMAAVRELRDQPAIM